MPVFSVSASSISQQARELSQRSASFAKSFSLAAKQVSQFVLPDVLLAVGDREPSLAASLLTVAEDSIVELRAGGEDMQQQQFELQKRVQALIDSTQSNEAGRGCELNMGLLPINVDKQLGSPRSVRTSSTEYESSSNASDDGYQSSEDGCQLTNDSKMVGHGAAFGTTAHQISLNCDEDSSLSTKLEVLKKIEEAIEADLAFWQDMNAAVQKLAQMKHHTACLIQFGCKNERLCARAEQRLDECTSAWASLEDPCQQYIIGRETSPISPAEFSDKAGAASDIADKSQTILQPSLCHLQCPVY